MRLIDADAFKEHLEESYEYTELSEVIEMLNNAPTIIWCSETSDGLPLMDLRPRPKGEWKLHGMIWYCSNCGKDCEQGGNNFCGNCGAKMKGGQNAEGRL
jgi:hypothetical protein